MVAVFALASTAAAQGAGLFAGEITAGRLHLRAGPGEAYQPVVTVERGAKIVVLSRHANDDMWYMVEVPGGYDAYAHGRYLAKQADGSAIVTAERVLVRPRATTRYHQLSGRLNKGERIKIVSEHRSGDEMWYRIRVPRRIPLWAYAKHVKNIGGAHLARAAVKPAARTGAPGKVARPLVIETEGDKRFKKIEDQSRVQLSKAESTDQVEAIKRNVATVDRTKLSITNRERLVSLRADLLSKERKIAIRELKMRENQVKSDLNARLAEIDRAYRKRLAEIRARYERERTKPHYIATGIVKWSPDIVGRYPAFRLSEGGKMKYYLIATQYDLSRFSGKRVGVVGIKDPESGTGFETIMVRRIEILGDK
ncbi:MAG: SH3 domain-containing protein [Planctomycetota bacterium]|nr:SH3 domain-containing protein [Planctomycetota bacterium]